MGELRRRRSRLLNNSELYEQSREMQAILEAVSLWRSSLQNAVLLVATDNTTAVAHINKQGD